MSQDLFVFFYVKTDDAEDEPKQKKGKTMLTIGSTNSRFEWENDGGKWTVYSDDFAGEILTAYNADKSEVVLEYFNITSFLSHKLSPFYVSSIIYWLI